MKTNDTDLKPYIAAADKWSKVSLIWVHSPAVENHKKIILQFFHPPK